MTYWRLHGIGGYRYRYSEEELEHLHGMLTHAKHEGRTPVYVMFNNVWMKDDAKRLQTLLQLRA